MPGIKVNRVPHRRSTIPPPKAAAPRGSFRLRYDKLETQRATPIRRLSALGEPVRRHSGRARALMLLNNSFRGSSLAQRAAVLQAAQ